MSHAASRCSARSEAKKVGSARWQIGLASQEKSVDKRASMRQHHGPG